MPDVKLEGTLPALQERSRESRDRLLLAAEEVFSERGYAGAKLTDIAERAGVAVGTVYNRFTDKEGLFSAVLQHYSQTTSYLLESGIDWEEQRNAPVSEVIQNFIYGGLETFLRNRGLFRAVIERGLHDADVWRPLIENSRNAETMLFRLLKNRSDELKATGLRRRLRMFFHFVYGTFTYALIQGRIDNAQLCKEMAEDLLEALTAYLGTQMPRRRRQLRLSAGDP